VVRSACGVLLSTTLFFLSGAKAADARLWIIGATVISGERVDNGLMLDVLVEGEQIKDVVPALLWNAPRDAPVFDAAGMYIAQLTYTRETCKHKFTVGPVVLEFAKGVLRYSDMSSSHLWFCFAFQFLRYGASDSFATMS